MIDTAEVSKIFETNHQDQANAYIAGGWVLLNTAGGRWSDSQEPCFNYSLGWTQGGQPAKIAAF